MCATDQQHPTAGPSGTHVIGQATAPAVATTRVGGLSDARTTALIERARRAHATFARFGWSSDVISQLSLCTSAPLQHCSVLRGSPQLPAASQDATGTKGKKKRNDREMGSSFCSFRPLDIAGPSLPNWVVGAQSGRSGARTSMREGGWVLSNSSAQCLFFVFSASACTVLA